MEVAKPICMAVFTTALTRMSLWNVLFEFAISRDGVGKTFPFAK